MKLFKISQSVNRKYDTYDSAIVCAKDEVEARKWHPAGAAWNASSDGKFLNRGKPWASWAHTTSQVEVVHIGEASPTTPRGIVLSSFNAG